MNMNNTFSICICIRICKSNNKLLLDLHSNRKIKNYIRPSLKGGEDLRHLKFKRLTFGLNIIFKLGFRLTK